MVKKSDPKKTSETPAEATPETVAAPSPEVPATGKVNKSQMVRDLIAKGITSPVDIVAAAKEMGVDISTNYASGIKGKKKEKKVKTASGKVAVAKSKTPPSDSSMELAALRLIIKAGGKAAAIEFIQGLDA